jgi:zinc protease
MGLLLAGQGQAALDLRNATVEKLPNGLTVILLEDRNFPVASVQMLYKVGARNEVTGQTGIAHFLEHMAFRAAEHFPGTDLVSSIYALGGEWHGYTWTDQTTYFATVPGPDLDLLLRIEADRITKLKLAEDVIEAERGAVLAEMHMYENYPTSMLIDALMFTSFQAHPYRNNTIGFESDIQNLTHENVVSFYRQHYHPANAVLAVVGDFDAGKVRARIGELFGDIAARPATPLPHTTEPLQSGERRVSINGSSHTRRFMIGYHAPSANHGDYAAFLVLQALLGSSSGVSFLQNDWGAPVDENSLLAGAADDLTTWYPPSAQDYIFVIGGELGQGATADGTEAAIEKRVATARQAPAAAETLARAINNVQDELVFDVETTEDAAHQLAYFAGLGALDVLLTLPERVATVSAEDVHHVANRYLKPERRTIAWYGPGEKQAIPPQSSMSPGAAESTPVAAVDDRPIASAVVSRLQGGIPVIFQESDFSSAAELQIVLQGNNLAGGSIQTNEPVRGYSALTYRMRPDALADVLGSAQADLASAEFVMQASAALSDDPEARLEETFDDLMQRGQVPQAGAVMPALIVLSGDVRLEAALPLLQQKFASLEPRAAELRPATKIAAGKRVVKLGVPVAQSALGYIVSAPGPGEADHAAWSLLLYILSHDYEGRLGVEAISKRGLAYYVDGRYRSDGLNGWMTLAVGVDPGKVDDLKSLLRDELQRLVDVPPSAAEVAEAKRHLIGRSKSGAQSNRERSSALAEQWLWYGEIVTTGALEERLAAVSQRDVADAAAKFVDGLTIVVGE